MLDAKERRAVEERAAEEAGDDKDNDDKNEGGGLTGALQEYYDDFSESDGAKAAATIFL